MTASETEDADRPPEARSAGVAPEGAPGPTPFPQVRRPGYGSVTRPARLRSVVAIGAGVAATHVCMPSIVSALEASFRHAAVRIYADPTYYLKPPDWAYLAFLGLMQFSPLLIAPIVSAAIAREARIDHAVIALDVCIVLWMVGVL